MDDDDKKFDRPKAQRGPKPAGERGGRKPAGKSFGGKPGGRSAGGKSFGAKPGGKSFGERSGEGGSDKRFGGKRPFVRDRAAAEGEGARPFRKGPRAERTGSSEGRGADDRPKFSRERSFSDQKRPYREKRPFSGDGDAPRPGRDFSHDRPPRAASGERPFRKEPRPDRASDDGRKPFRERAASGERSFGKGPKPAWKQEGERKPFEKRGGFEKRDAGQRPGRFEREQARKEEGDKPRSFGMKRHAEARGESSQRPRSYGQKSHGDAERSDRARRAEAAEESSERIAKRLARAGIASRREAEDLVAAGRIRVNGQVLSSPAFNVAVDDRIEVDGNEIPPIERTRLFLFHKPAGVVTTNRDPEGRKTVFDVLPESLPRLMTVGRLDINTEGLLLLTNDGGLARVLELPTTGWLRRYRVRVHGEVDEKALAALKDGIAVDGVFYGAIDASLERVQGTNAWLTMGLREGKNREVKNVLGALGLGVTRLIRVSFGPFQLGELPEGQVQELKGRTLRDQLGDRLIEEAGANFEAPITKPFSNKAEQSYQDRPARSVRAPAPLAAEPGDGGLIKSRKRRREDARDDALGRLSTRPERGGFGGRGGKRFEGARDKAEDKPRPGQRKSNVWMAPGARPQGEGKAAPKGKSPGAKGGSGASSGRPPSPRHRGDGKAPRGPRKG